MNGKEVVLGSHDRHLITESALKEALAKIPSVIADDPKGEQALRDLSNLSHSEGSSESTSPNSTPPPSSPTRNSRTNKSKTMAVRPTAGYHEDLKHLRSQLGNISKQHYDVFWAENGPMWHALHDKFRAKELFDQLPKDYLEKGHNSNQLSPDILEKFRRREIDDYSLFNKAYGLNNSLNNSEDGLRSGYFNYNLIIQATIERLSQNATLQNIDLEYHRWNALFRLTNELTAFNKTIYQKPNALKNPDKDEISEIEPSDIECSPYRSITDIYSVLENLRAPLTILRTQPNYQGIFTSVSSFYESAQDQIFLYLFFSSHFRKTQIQDILKPLKKSTANKLLALFEKGEMNEACLKTELRKLYQKPSEQLNKIFQEIDNLPDNQKTLADFLDIQLPENGISYAQFLQQVEEKAKAQSKLPLYKREVAKQISRFAKGDITHTQFLGQLKIISLNNRPQSFWTRLGHYLGGIVLSLLTLDFGFTRFISAKHQYDDIYQLNKAVRKNYKDTAANRDENIAILSVSNDVLPVTVNGIKNQDETKVTDILWLNEQEKARCESLNSAFTPLTKRPGNSNPHYATALSKLHFLARQKTNFETTTQQLEKQVEATIQAHQQIKSNPTRSRDVPEESKETKKSIVRAITLGLGLERKTLVYSSVVETLAHEPRSLSVAG